MSMMCRMEDEDLFIEERMVVKMRDENDSFRRQETLWSRETHGQSGTKRQEKKEG